MSTADFPAKCIEDLISTYHELNPSEVDELDEVPSPLEFMRYVARNRPFVVRKGARDWPACQKWNAAHLIKIMGDQMVNVAITPHGNADSVLHLENGSTLFVKPYETESRFSDALTYISKQGLDPGNQEPAWYCQTQNDNLRNEYHALFADVPTSIPFARIALQHDPDAINFWLGNSRSTTALHKDPYENIYVQILGRKHFTLLPPISAPCVNERRHTSCTYDSHLQPIPDDDSSTQIPFATWDPDDPDQQHGTRFSHLNTPSRVTLQPGDMLYLPALWYHKVSQSCSEEGVSCAVNYWYDMDYSGGFYALSQFVKDVGAGCVEDGEKAG